MPPLLHGIAIMLKDWLGEPRTDEGVLLCTVVNRSEPPGYVETIEYRQVPGSDTVERRVTRERVYTSRIHSPGSDEDRIFPSRENR